MGVGLKKDGGRSTLNDDDAETDMPRPLESTPGENDRTTTRNTQK